VGLTIVIVTSDAFEGTVVWTYADVMMSVETLADWRNVKTLAHARIHQQE